MQEQTCLKKRLIKTEVNHNIPMKPPKNQSMEKEFIHQTIKKLIS